MLGLVSVDFDFISGPPAFVLSSFERTGQWQTCRLTVGLCLPVLLQDFADLFLYAFNDVSTFGGRNCKPRSPSVDLDS